MQNAHWTVAEQERPCQFPLRFPKKKEKNAGQARSWKKKLFYPTIALIVIVLSLVLYSFPFYDDSSDNGPEIPLVKVESTNSADWQKLNSKQNLIVWSFPILHMYLTGNLHN